MNMNNTELKEILFQGLSPGKWGYGFKRISVELPQEIKKMQKMQYTFTSVGFKSEKGEYFIGLRMNVDQRSPIKFRKCVESTNVIQSWVEMLQEYIQDYKIKFNSVPNATYRII